MKESSCGIGLFITDLVIASVWAMCALKFTSVVEYWLLAAIILRIAVSFQIFRNSVWAGYSAIVFAAFYIISPSAYDICFQPVVGGVIHYFLNVIDWNWANDLAMQSDHTGYIIWFGLLWGLQTAWIAAIPLAVAIRRRLFGFPKWWWVNIAILIVTMVMQFGWSTYWFNFNVFSIWAVATCFLPAVCWIVSKGKKESLVDVVLRHRPLMIYCSFVALIIGAMVIGFRNVYMLRGIGLVIFPALFYALLAKTVGVRSVPTYDTLAMSVAGVMYMIAMECGQTLTIALLLFAVLIFIIVGVRLFWISSSVAAGIGLIAGATFLICPSLIGMNPYVVTDSCHTRLYMRMPDAYNGLFVTRSEDYRYGLRDRYGEILPMKYYFIEPITDGYRNILRCEILPVSDSDQSETKYEYFDLERRAFITPSGNIVTE